MAHRSPLILLDRYPDDASDAWRHLLRDVVGGGSASSALIAALDGPVDSLLEGVDVEAALDAADAPRPVERAEGRRELLPADA
jgi:hypothetical protein